MIDRSVLATRSQVDRYGELYKQILDIMGVEAADPTSDNAFDWANDGNKTEREMFDYAIHLAEAKLNAPVIVLDPTEYEEAIRGEEIISNMGAGL